MTINSAQDPSTHLVANLADMSLGESLPDHSSLNDYPDTSQIILRLNEDKPAVNIPTESLRVNGDCRQDKMEVYLGKSLEQYFSSSTLKASLRTPLDLFYAIDQGWKDELQKHQNKKAFELGTFLHECILEPTRFGRVTVEPKLSRSTKDGVSGLISFWESTIRETCVDPESLIIIAKQTENDITKIAGMREYLANLIDASGIMAVKEADYLQIKITERNYKSYAGGILPKLLKWSKREISFYATEPETGLKLRVRPDAIQFKENIGVDAIISVKSTRQNNLDAFYRQSANLNYELSEGMYQDVVSQVTGRKFLTTLMIMVQTCAPYAVALLRWSPEDLENGKYKFRTALGITKECIDKGKFPGFEAFSEKGNFGIIEMKQPKWSQKVLPEIDVEN